MHYWGEWPDDLFAQVEQAALEIGEFCRRWGRIQVTQTKEKCGTARVYCHFGCRDLHSFFYPGYVWVGGPAWLFKLLGKALGYSIMTFPLFRPLSGLVLRWQRVVYRNAYRRALRRYPQIRNEILHGADFKEFLTEI
jgi:hypothetical protein